MNCVVTIEGYPGSNTRRKARDVPCAESNPGSRRHMFEAMKGPWTTRWCRHSTTAAWVEGSKAAAGGGGELFTRGADHAIRCRQRGLANLREVRKPMLSGPSVPHHGNTWREIFALFVRQNREGHPGMHPKRIPLKFWR